MNIRTTLILLVIALAGVAYFFFVEQPRHERALQGEIEDTRLTLIDAADVIGLTIERPDVTFEFGRLDDGWIMTSPMEDLADPAAVNTLLATAAGAEIERRIAADEGDVAHYGLSPPEATLLLSTNDDADALVLHLGALTLRKEFCYAQLAGEDEVILLPAGLRRYALRTLFEFRDKRIARFAVEDVTRMIITSSERSLAWHRTGGDSWVTYQSGDTIPGDATKVEAILRELRGLRAEEILPDNPDDLRNRFPDPRTITITVAPDLIDQVFIFGEQQPTGVYVRMADRERVALVESTVLYAFNRTYEDLRDRAVLHFDLAAIRRMTFQSPDLTTTLIKPGSEWAFVNPVLGEVDQRTAVMVLTNLLALKFTEILEERGPDGDYGLDPPAMVLELYDDDDTLVDRLVAGPALTEKRVRYATSASTGYVGTIEVELLEQISGALENIKVE